MIATIIFSPFLSVVVSLVHFYEAHLLLKLSFAKIGYFVVMKIYLKVRLYKLEVIENIKTTITIICKFVCLICVVHYVCYLVIIYNFSTSNVLPYKVE